MRDIGKNIRNARNARGMTQDDFAAKLHVTRQTVSNYEHGKTKPDIDMLVLIADVLGTDVSSVIYGNPVLDETRRNLRKVAICLGIELTIGSLYFVSRNVRAQPIQ